MKTRKQHAPFYFNILECFRSIGTNMVTKRCKRGVITLKTGYRKSTYWQLPASSDIPQVSIMNKNYKIRNLSMSLISLTKVFEDVIDLTKIFGHLIGENENLRSLWYQIFVENLKATNVLTCSRYS